VDDEIIFARLSGVVKLLDTPFTFALPVFVSPYSAGSYLVQDVTTAGIIGSFVYADIEIREFHPVTGLRKRRLGDPAFIAFEFTPGDFQVEERGKLLPLIRDVLHRKELQARPFTCSAVALFCGETAIASEADAQAIASLPPGGISRQYYRLNVLTRDQIKQSFLRYAVDGSTLPKFRLIEQENGLKLELSKGASDRDIALMKLCIADCGSDLARFADLPDNTRWQCSISLEEKERPPEKAHPVVPGWSICSIRVACARDLRRARGGTGWRGRDR